MPKFDRAVSNVSISDSNLEKLVEETLSGVIDRLGREFNQEDNGLCVQLKKYYDDSSFRRALAPDLATAVSMAYSTESQSAQDIFVKRVSVCALGIGSLVALCGNLWVLPISLVVGGGVLMTSKAFRNRSIGNPEIVYQRVRDIVRSKEDVCFSALDKIKDKYYENISFILEEPMLSEVLEQTVDYAFENKEDDYCDTYLYDLKFISKRKKADKPYRIGGLVRASKGLIARMPLEDKLKSSLLKKSDREYAAALSNALIYYRSKVF